MVYSKEKFGSRKQFDKYERCIDELKKNSSVNPYAICRSSIYKVKM